MSAQPATHPHRGHGHCGGEASHLLPSPGRPLPYPAIGPILPQQTAGERLGVQAAGGAEQPGAEADQEVTVQGCKEGKPTPHQAGRLQLGTLKLT